MTLRHYNSEAKGNTTTVWRSINGELFSCNNADFVYQDFAHPLAGVCIDVGSNRMECSSRSASLMETEVGFEGYGAYTRLIGQGGCSAI